MKSKLQLLHWNKWRTDWPSSPLSSFPFLPRFVFFGCTCVCSSYYSLFAAWGKKGILPLAETVPTVVLTGLLLFLTVLSSHSWNQSPRTGLGQIWQWAQIYFFLFILVVLLMFSRCVLLFCFLLKGSFFSLSVRLFVPLSGNFLLWTTKCTTLLLQIGREREKVLVQCQFECCAFLSPLFSFSLLFWQLLVSEWI